MEVLEKKKVVINDFQSVPLDLLKVTGRYSVWLADGRLMIVEYTADLQSGFVPRISFVNSANPITG